MNNGTHVPKDAQHLCGSTADQFDMRYPIKSVINSNSPKLLPVSSQIN